MERARFATEIRWLLQTALVVFIAVPVIGILNGTKALGDLSRDTILTHVHAGTLGWITLGAFAMVLWLFGPAVPASKDRNTRMLAIMSACAIPVYVLAFFSGNLPARAITGTILLLIILMWAVFTIGAASAIGFRRLSVPQLAVTLALVTFVIGSSLGVLIQIQLATGATILSPQGVGAHAAAQVTGYLALMAVALIDWRVLGDTSRRTLAATIMVLALFVSGLSIATGLLLNVIPLAGLATPLELIAVGILLARVGGPALRGLGSASTRHFAIAVPFLLLNIALTIVLLVRVISSGNFEDIPFGLIIALDHAMFVGTMTNVLFGVLFVATERHRVWGWADDLVFWGMNLGVAAFIAVLLIDARELERYTAPVMGAAVLLAIATFTLRLRAGREAATAVAGVPA